LKRGTLTSYKERMVRVLEYILKNLDEPMPLADLAGVACFSPYHFHRIFRGIMGRSVIEHVRLLRLERAAGSLLESAKPIIQIALDAGYESHEAFSRAFRKKYGLSPSRFRRTSGVDCRRHGNEMDRLVTQMGQPFAGEVIVNVTIKTVAAKRVAYMEHRGPYNECGGTWDRFLPELGKRGLLGGENLILGLCHNDPEVTPPEDIRYDACVVVDDDFQAEGEIKVQVIEGGEYAVTTHFGPYHQLNLSYAALAGSWLPNSGRELRSAPAYEIYITDPEGTEPEDMITDIYMPLETSRGEN